MIRGEKLVTLMLRGAYPVILMTKGECLVTLMTRDNYPAKLMLTDDKG